VLLYRMAYGKLPFEGDALLQIAQGKVNYPHSQFSPNMEALIRKQPPRFISREISTN
jgi:hypothetical protein